MTAKVATDASGAATEKFIDLRGSNAKVHILNSSYTYDPAGKANAGGFTNDLYLNNMLDKNKVWFDEEAKANFTSLIDNYENVAIRNYMDPNDLYRLVRTNDVVALIPDPEPAMDVKYYFPSLAEAINRPYFKAEAQIDALADLTIN